MSKSCPACGSSDLINAKVKDKNESFDQDFCVHIDNKPDALFFKDRTYYKLNAKICEKCKNVSFWI